MKKLAALLLSALFLLPLTACRTKETASRAETVQERYAALTSYTAAAAVELADEEENVRYTLRFDADAEETRVTVLAPELLAGVTAHLAADTLKLEYDGLVLDAGGTPGGVRPVLIIQNDTGNRYSPTVIAAAITSQTNKAKLPTHIALSAPDHGLPRDSVVLLEQVRTLDKRRLRERMGRVDGELMERIDAAIAVSFGLGNTQLI